MLAVTQHRHRRGLLGRTAASSVALWSPAAASAGVPIATTPPGTAPGTISTTPTVMTVQTAPPVTASPPSEPPGTDVPIVFPSTADTPTVTASPSFDPTLPTMPQAPGKAWVPWAIGGGVVAALGAVIFGVLHR